MEVNLDACIHCNLCVRACREVQVNDVIGMANRGSNAKIVFERNLLCSNGLLILEHSSQKNFEKSANFMEQRTYSSVNFSFFHA